MGRLSKQKLNYGGPFVLQVSLFLSLYIPQNQGRTQGRSIQKFSIMLSNLIVLFFGVQGSIIQTIQKLKRSFFKFLASKLSQLETFYTS